MKFRKTAANFHYEFNVRHLTNVFQGLLTARTDTIKEADNIRVAARPHNDDDAAARHTTVDCREDAGPARGRFWEMLKQYSKDCISPTTSYTIEACA